MSKTIDDTLEALADFCNGLEALAINLRKQISEMAKPQLESLTEETFNILSWQTEKGSTLGAYEVAYKKENLPEKWQHAYQILKVNNALISNALKNESWTHRYWIYPDKYQERIYRKKE